MFLSILRVLQSFRSRFRSPLSLWPRRPETLLGCVLIAISTMFLSSSPVEPFDYSNVSGYFGPGAFAAWVITCFAGFCPAEGRHLVRFIWKESYHIPHRIDSFAMLEYPREDCKNYASGIRTCCENSQPEVVKLDSEKMKCLQKFLEYTLQATMNETDDRPFALRQFLHEIQSNDREIRALQRESADNLLLQAECAELVLDSLPLFFKRDSLKYPGFVQYGIYEHENDISGQSCDRLVESLASTFTWFEMSRADFIHCLLHFRNGVQFWSYQITQSEAEIADKMDPNTWAAIIYPIVACWVCLAKQITSNIETWRPEDDAAACVAQFAIGVSSIALIGSRYRIVRADRIFRFQQRSLAWMVVHWHSCVVLIFRLVYMSESSFSVQLLGIFHTFTIMLSLAFEMVLHVYLVPFRPPSSFSSWHCPECAYPAHPKGYQRRLWAFTVELRSLAPHMPQMSAVSIIPWLFILPRADVGDIGDARIVKIQRGTRLGLLIPGSSANISDLDQAAALATALALALMAPLGTLASRARAFWVRQRTYQSTG